MHGGGGGAGGGGRTSVRGVGQAQHEPHRFWALVGALGPGGVGHGAFL